jgi:hypothetical protein
VQGVEKIREEERIAREVRKAKKTYSLDDDSSIQWPWPKPKETLVVLDTIWSASEC